jgi:hypothetical protein
MSRRTLYRRLADAGGPRKPRISTCPVCGTVFAYSRRATCSSQCFSRLQSLRMRPDQGDGDQAKCEVCSCLFIPPSTNRQRKTCSSACRSEQIRRSHLKRPRQRLKCRACKKDFTPPRNSMRRTCSRRCLGDVIRRRRAAGRRSPSEKPCAVCGKTMQLSSDAAADNKQTCSSTCFQALCSVKKGGLGEATCEGCDKTYSISRFYVRAGRRFCGDACRLRWFVKQTPVGEGNPNWKGGGGNDKRYYGPSWPEAKRQTRLRANNTCEECGKTRAELGKTLHVHHVMPFRLFTVERHLEANALCNLRCVCASCHVKIEWREANRLTRSPDT